VHHPHSHRLDSQRIATLSLLVLFALVAPDLSLAQTSPFMTGATALQTNLLAWLTPVAIILVMVLGGMGWQIGSRRSPIRMATLARKPSWKIVATR